MAEKYSEEELERIRTLPHATVTYPSLYGFVSQDPRRWLATVDARVEEAILLKSILIELVGAERASELVLARKAASLDTPQCSE